MYIQAINTETSWFLSSKDTLAMKEMYELDIEGLLCKPISYVYKLNYTSKGSVIQIVES